MTSELWRKRVVLALMSLFVSWHTLALVVAPAPDGSKAAQALRVVLGPYLSLFRLDNRWGFFAPEVGKGQQLRYLIEDAAGNGHTVVPYDEWSPYLPTSIWYRIWYDVILDQSDDYADAGAALLCKKHAALNPIAITLMKVEERDFSPADHLRGKHPLDSEFVTVSTVKRVKCPS